MTSDDLENHYFVSTRKFVDLAHLLRLSFRSRQSADWSRFHSLSFASSYLALCMSLSLRLMQLVERSLIRLSVLSRPLMDRSLLNKLSLRSSEFVDQCRLLSLSLRSRQLMDLSLLLGLSLRSSKFLVPSRLLGQKGGIGGTVSREISSS